jgi:transcriptional regulator with XRE-family HTH domain
VPSDIPSWVLHERQRVGRRVRAIRTSAGLSQERLAHAAGVDRHTIYRTELGTNSISVDNLLLIARALDVHPAQFLRDE